MAWFEGSVQGVVVQTRANKFSSSETVNDEGKLDLSISKVTITDLLTCFSLYSNSASAKAVLQALITFSDYKKTGLRMQKIQLTEMTETSKQVSSLDKSNPIKDKWVQGTWLIQIKYQIFCLWKAPENFFFFLQSGTTKTQEKGKTFIKKQEKSTHWET